MANKIYKSPLEQSKDVDLAWKLSEYLDNEPEIDEDSYIEEVIRPYTSQDKLNVPVEDAVRAFLGNSGLTGTNTWKDWLKYNHLIGGE